ncbi:MAG: DegT/DnrJ/EryC1/StrS family aminotransferase [Candidatus Eremiobacteraeota bacterium]|nr:DegT/DnrJ/EryC1/StrS family aminotransferase [Candidatus Eremiobacteraeota bacterium]
MPDYAIQYKYPLVDLKREYNLIGEKVTEAIRKVLARSDFILGKEVREFEQMYADYCGVKHCIGVGSGTAALYISLISYNIGKGDDVVLPAFTFKASAMAVTMTGARAVLCDVENDTGNIDPDLLEKSITSKTKAIMPVHMYGHVTDMDRIAEIAKKYDIPIIEDACEAQGAEYKDIKAGSMGACGAFSFYPSKILGCYGDGGAIITNDDKLKSEVLTIRSYGNCSLPGVNSRLATIQAAILKVKFKYINKWIQRRREIAKRYGEMLGDLPLELPPEKDYAKHVYYLFVIKTKRRNDLKAYLNERGIEARIHFSPPIHLMKNIPNDEYSKGSFPVAEKHADEVLSLPIYPFMEDTEVEQISKSIRDYFEK